MTRCLLVVGYNNVRIYDVAKLRAIAAREHGLKLMLVTEAAQSQDSGAADVVLTCPLSVEALERSLHYVQAELIRLRLEPVGILPFSDRGVLLGAALAQHYRLPGARVDDAKAGLDKRVLRQREREAAHRPAGYQALFSKQIRTLEDLHATVALLGERAFIKPAGEGNSRGCSTIERLADCAVIWNALAIYHEDGVIVEELVTQAREYSWDYVAGRQWITEKRTTEGEFRAEYQQIVHAPLSADAHARITAAGEHIRSLVSELNGAYHNEVFLRENGSTSAVETNMRPGGMHIWDLAQRAFVDFDPWHEWIRWATTGDMSPSHLQPRAFSGIRMIRAPRNGVLKSYPNLEVLALHLGLSPDEMRISKKIGERVTATPRNNADFIGEVMLQWSDYDGLVERLAHLTQEIESRIEVEPEFVGQQPRPHPQGEEPAIAH